MSLSVKYQKAQEQLAVLEKKAQTCLEEHKEGYQKAILAQKQEIQSLGIQIEKASAVNAQRTLANAQCADGKNDGKTSWGSKLWNGIKGVGNFFKNMVCDEKGNLSWGKVAVGVGAIIGAAALSVIPGGAVVLTGLAVAGGIPSVIQTGKGFKAAWNAKTDAEMDAACQQIGEGLTGVALSWTGIKAAASASRAVNGGKLLGWGRKPLFKKINFEQNGIHTLDDLRNSPIYNDAKGILNGKGYLENAFKSEKYLKVIKADWFKKLTPAQKKAALKNIDGIAATEGKIAQLNAKITKANEKFNNWKKTDKGYLEALKERKNLRSRKETLDKEIQQISKRLSKAKNPKKQRQISSEKRQKELELKQIKNQLSENTTNINQMRKTQIQESGLDQVRNINAEIQAAENKLVELKKSSVLSDETTVETFPLPEQPTPAGTSIYEDTALGKMVNKVKANRFGLNTLDPRYGTSTWGVDSPHKLAALVGFTGTSAVTLKDHIPVRIPAEYVDEFKQVIIERSKAAPLSTEDATELARQFLEIKAQQKAEAEAAQQQAQNQTSSASLTTTEIGKFGTATNPAYSGSYL